MRKKAFSLICVLILTVLISIPVFADQSGVYIIDEPRLLSDNEIEELHYWAADLTERYHCGVYISIIYDYTDWGSTPQLAAEALFEACDYGLNTDRSGIMLMLSMDDRDFSLIGHGLIGNGAMTDYGREVMIDGFLDDFADDNWYGGFCDYLEQAEFYFQRYEEGEPFDAKHDRPGYFFSYGIGMAVGLVAAVIVCFALKAQMETAIKKTQASDYITTDGIDIHQRSDRFSHTTTTRTKIQSNSSGRGGGGGTSVNSRGYSGSSGKF